LVIGGVASSLAGLLVGGPSLRLKGDYLAIVTLGFGEIIRVLFRNVESLGGALGLTGIPPYTNVFWTFGFAAITIYCVVSLVHSTYGRGFLAVRDDEIAAEAMGINRWGSTRRDTRLSHSYLALFSLAWRAGYSLIKTWRLIRKVSISCAPSRLWCL
jgi:ABC-type branched-subunit amino acid transport system permease subunit